MSTGATGELRNRVSGVSARGPTMLGKRSTLNVMDGVCWRKPLQKASISTRSRTAPVVAFAVRPRSSGRNAELSGMAP